MGESSSLVVQDFVHQQYFIPQGDVHCRLSHFIGPMGPRHYHGSQFLAVSSLVSLKWSWGSGPDFFSHDQISDMIQIEYIE